MRSLQQDYLNHINKKIELPDSVIIIIIVDVVVDVVILGDVFMFA